MAPGLLADSHHDAVFRRGKVMILWQGIVPRGKGGIKHKEEEWKDVLGKELSAE